MIGEQEDSKRLGLHATISVVPNEEALPKGAPGSVGTCDTDIGCLSCVIRLKCKPGAAVVLDSVCDESGVSQRSASCTCSNAFIARILGAIEVCYAWMLMLIYRFLTRSTREMRRVGIPSSEQYSIEAFALFSSSRSVVLPFNQQGGLEIVVSLFADEMDELLRDEEFEQYATFFCD